MPERAEITELLNAAQAGDAPAAQAAFELIYDELKACARNRARAVAPGASLTPTELVSELYLRLMHKHHGGFHNRQHFFSLAARAMRQIMVDQARTRGRRKRGGDVVFTDFEAQGDIAGINADTALELDAALTDLFVRDARLAQIVEWHFFAGMDFQDIADELGQHERTVRRDWELARACLRRFMDAPAP